MSILMLVDTPNITKSVTTTYGPRVRPDYKRMYNDASEVGPIKAACALVNDGVSPVFKDNLTRIGFDVKFSHAMDCDDALFAWAVRLHSQANTVILCSGDGGFTPLVTLLKSLGIAVIVRAVRGACSQKLKNAASLYSEVPLKS
jgi:uncharacterized LabA/DUF88 family protein